MAPSTTQLEEEVSACTESSNPPTREQVWRLIRAAKYSEDSLETIRKKLFLCLNDPGRFHVSEVEHTLVVVQQCSLIAPPEFVDYFKSRIYAVAALINFHSRAAAASNKRVRQKARMLFELLDDDAKFQEERNKCVQSWSEPNPARSPHRTSDSGHESTSGRNRGSPSSALPTPRASPVHDSSDLDPDNERNGNHGRESYYGRTEPPAKEIVEEMVRGATANIPPDVTREKMDQIASCTFDSCSLEIVISVLVERLFVLTGQHIYHHLRKTLRIVDHCLRYGSSDFAAWFKEHRDMISTLSTSSVGHVINRLARGVLNLLDDQDSREAIPAMQTPPSSPPQTPPSPISSTSDTIPPPESVKDLSPFITTIGDYPLSYGGYSIVYKAVLNVGFSQEIVAKKVLISRDTIPQARLQKRISREIRAWTGLQHPNIARLYGTTREANGSIGLISHFFECGNIVDYIKSADKSKLNILKLLHGTTSGVDYLHGEGIVHGDIKGSNVMVDDEGRAKLIDFGVSRITGEHGHTTSGSGASWAWAAPELVPYDDKAVPKTYSTDIWALAITFVEVMTGRSPPSGVHIFGILSNLRNGVVPERPSPNDECYFCPGDRLWALLLCCWASIPEDRPTISTIQAALDDLVDTSEI